MASRRMTRFGAAASMAAVVLSLSASAALAGEVTGNGKPLWTDNKDWADPHHTLHGKSACAFSGQEDDQFPLAAHYSPTAGHSQSWGQIARNLNGADGGVPGTACNPTRSSGE